MKQRPWRRCFHRVVGFVMIALAILLLAPVLSLTINTQARENKTNKSDGFLDAAPLISKLPDQPRSRASEERQVEDFLDPVSVASKRAAEASTHAPEEIKDDAFARSAPSMPKPAVQAVLQNPPSEMSLSVTKATDASTHEQPWFSFPNKVDTVWIDVGTAARSDFHWDLKFKKSVYLIGIEPTPHFARASRKALNSSSTRARFTILQRACTEFSEPRTLTFFKHLEHECNSLNADNQDRSVQQIAGGACMGKPAQEIKVQTVTLQEVITRVPAKLRIQLLKLDVQGHEWPCLKGGAQELSRVDNIFIEVQDLDRKLAMYKDSLNVGDMDHNLGALGFERQYCEANNMALREVNCLYTRQGKLPLWVTGRPQKGNVTNEDLSKPPNFHAVHYLASLHTAQKLGALMHRVTGFRTIA